jgi:hypothetical protein
MRIYSLNGEWRIDNGETTEISSFFERLSEANREKKEANGGKES